MSASQRSDTQISLFTRLISWTPVFPVIVALLAGLGRLEIIPDNANLLFSLLNNVWTNERPFPSFWPIQRGSALTSIEHFKGCHLQAGLIAVVIRELRIRERFFPLLAERNNTSSKHVFKNLIDSLDLALGLGMISSAPGNMSSHCLLETIPELWSEYTATVWTDLLRNAVEWHNSGDIQVC